MRLLLRHFGVGIVEPYEGKSEDGDDDKVCSSYRSTTEGSLIIGCYNDDSGITEGVFIRRGGVGPGSGAAVQGTDVDDLSEPSVTSLLHETASYAAFS